MTANDAAKIVADAEPKAVPERVDALLTKWYAAITAAAKENKHQAFERDVTKLRLAVTRQDQAAVHDRLKADGYTLDRAADGELIVSWPAVPTTVADSATVPTIPPTE